MVLSKEYYINLSIEELAQQEYFIQHIKTPSVESNIFWKEFLLEWPDQEGKMLEAGKLVRSLKFNRVEIQEGLKENLWKKIRAESNIDSKEVRMPTKRRWLWAAAAASILLLLTVGYFLTRESKERVNTQFAEVRQLVLPDQSVVTLNANSSIRFKKTWKSSELREVWLKGEAYFDVKHLNQGGQPVKEHERFIVHTGEADVEVLGTSFNVSDRQAITKVVLQSGKVRIDFKEKNTSSVVMEPGEIVKYDQQTRRLVREKTATEKYTSWKRKEFLLDNTSVEEIIAVIENTFGYKVVIEGKDMLNRQLSGTGKISLENEETLFKSLELLLEVSITKKDDTLYIRKK